MDAFSARAGVLDGYAAAGHAEVVVRLDAGGAFVLGVIAVVGDAARDVDGRSAALDEDIPVGADAFFGGRGGRYGEGTAAHLDIFVAADAVAGGAAGADRHGRGVEEADIVVGSDAGLSLLVAGGNRQTAAPGEDKLPLREEDGLHVLVAGSRIGGGTAIGEGIRSLDDDIAALLALDVDGGAAGAGKGQVAQNEGHLLGAVELEAAVGGRSRKLVDDVLVAGAVDGDAVAADGDAESGGAAVSVDRGACGGIMDGHRPGEGRRGNVVVGGRITAGRIGPGSRPVACVVIYGRRDGDGLLRVFCRDFVLDAAGQKQGGGRHQNRGNQAFHRVGFRFFLFFC